MAARTTLSVLLLLVVATGSLATREPSFARSLQGATCAFACSKPCAVCKSVGPTNGGADKAVVIDVSTCKGDALSWMCCRGATGPAGVALDCNRQACSGKPDPRTSKCDEVTASTYVVPAAATSLTIQLHDGKAGGDITCVGTPGQPGSNCCGGSSSSCANSGVCAYTVDLSTCPDTPECTQNRQCSHLDGPCSAGVCNAGTCTAAMKPSGTECRAAAGPCDVAETCDGESAACPKDDKEPATTQCRAAAGPCDEADFCTGSDDACPTDAMKPSGTECRAAAGPCDVAETCDGESAACPKDDKEPATTQCRAAVNACDQPELCSGTGDLCPADELRRNKGKGFKCGRDCFFCGAESQAELTRLTNTWGFGSCNMGSCSAFFFLPKSHAMCTGAVPLTCPNGKALSNIEHAVCDTITGGWTCVAKQEAPFSGPVSPPW